MKNFSVLFSLEAFDKTSSTIDRINERFSKLGGNLQGFTNRFDILKTKTKAWTDSMEKVGSSLKNAGTIMSVGVTAPLTLLAGKMLHASMEAEEASSMFNQVFETVGEGVRGQAVANLSSQFGLATSSAHTLLAETGMLAKDLGFTGDQALQMSEQVAGLSVQFAKFRNVQGGASAVSEVFQAAMRGNYKSLSKLGIVITDAQLKAESLEFAKKKLSFATVEQAQAAVVASLLQKRTTDAQKDFAESTDTLSSKLSKAKELFTELSTTFGDVLKPVAVAILSVFNKIMKWFINLSPATKKIIVIFAAMAAAIGPILVGLGVLIGTILPALITGFLLLSAAGFPVFGTILAITAAITALIGIGVGLIVFWDDIKAALSNGWDFIANAAVTAFQKIKDFFYDTFPGTMKFLEDMFAKISSVIGGIYSMTGQIRGAGAIRVENKTASENIISGGGSPIAATAQASEIGRSIVKELRTVNDAKVQIDFSNMPKDTKVSTSATGAAPFMNLGSLGGSF